jgi:hypothetical protein
MLLSEAMRLGAMLGPQAFNVAFDGESHCALGGAALAFGFGGEREHTGEFAINYLCEIFPSLAEGLGRLIAVKNDVRRMTREQIADWLVESGNDCESVTTAPSEQIAAALVTEMVAR